MSMTFLTNIQIKLMMFTDSSCRRVVLTIFLTSLTSSPLMADVDTPVEDTAYLLCGGCHGQTNIRTVEDMSPNIIGQKKGYLIKQMRAYRDMKRIHPDMNGIMQPYSDRNIEDLANYYANTSVDLPNGKMAQDNQAPKGSKDQKHSH